MNINERTQRIAFFSIMLGIIIVLSFIEHMLPPLPLMPPNVKLGLSNIVTMYCVFFIGKKDAIMLAILKSIFVFLMRGPIAGILSFCGGVSSIIVIIVLISMSGNRLSYLILSISGAIAHNIGQIAGASLVLKYNLLFYYFPVSVVAGVVMGTVTGTLLKVTLPLFERLDKLKKT